MQRLSFADGSNDSKNMLMRGCFFSTLDPRYVYTLSTENRQKAYLIKWSNKANYTDKTVMCEPEDVAVVHNNTVTGLCCSTRGDKIGIRTSDGWIKVVNTRNMNDIIVSQKRHRMPVTCLGFKYDGDGDAEAVISGSSDYTYNIIPCKESLIGK